MIIKEHKTKILYRYTIDTGFNMIRVRQLLLQRPPISSVAPSFFAARPVSSSASFFTPLTTNNTLSTKVIHRRSIMIPTIQQQTVQQQNHLGSILQRHGLRFSSVLKKRRKKMRKHKLRKMRRIQRRSNKNKE